MVDAVVCLKEGEKFICYINAASSNEHCTSLLNFFSKHWSAECKEIIDVGYKAEFDVILSDTSFKLLHDSHLGNYLEFNEERDYLSCAKIIDDLRKRLS